MAEHGSLPVPSRNQIRGARAMLGWSLVDLARSAGVSPSGVRRAEADGPAGLPADMVDSIRRALESRGIVFLPDEGGGPGLRLRA